MDISDRIKGYEARSEVNDAVTTWAAGDWSPVAVIAGMDAARAAGETQAADDLEWFAIFLAWRWIESVGQLGHLKPERLFLAWRYGAASAGRPL